jgi:type II secretory pathway predicted ATPase ExeA
MPGRLRLRRLTAEGQRQLVEDMAVVLIGEPDLASDLVCVFTLLAQRFHIRDIDAHFDAARTIARQALADEAGLWERLMR